MEHKETNQQADKSKKNLKQTPAKEMPTFSERIEYTKDNTSANQELTDEYGELGYREHDEFGEWLDRHQ